MSLLLFDEVRGLSDDKRHDKFKLLRDNVKLSAEKQLLSTYTNGLVDRDKKMVRQFQETFHSTYWEICIYQLCLEAGFILDQSHPSPDFIIKKPVEFYIEAVVSNIKQNGKPENQRTLKDQLSMLISPNFQEDFSDVLDESIVRNLSSILFKNGKYESYRKYEWVNEDKPFIIALSSHDQINYGREFIYSMLALLYGRYYIPSYNCYIKKESIHKKETNAELDIGIFLKSDFSHISAIMYTCTNTIGKLTALALSNGFVTYNSVLNVIRDMEDNDLPFKFQVVNSSHPESISNGIFIFHNPYAKAPVDPKLFEKTNVTHFFLKNDKICTLGMTTPIYTRFSIDSVIAQYLFGDLIASLAISWNEITPDNIDRLLGMEL